MIIAAIFFGVYKFVSYGEYTEEYSYDLQEIKDDTYAIYHSVNIQQTNDKPYIEITAKPHINYGDEITVFIPKGTVEFADNVGLR